MANEFIAKNGLIAPRVHSTITTGTSPLVVASTTKVDNLNADLLDGLSSAAFATAAQGTLADSSVQPGDPITDLNGGNWKVVYTNGSGDVTELALGAAGTGLRSAGTTSAPTFATPMTGSEIITEIDAQLDDDFGAWRITPWDHYTFWSANAGTTTPYTGNTIATGTGAIEMDADVGARFRYTSHVTNVDSGGQMYSGSTFAIVVGTIIWGCFRTGTLTNAVAYAGVGAPTSNTIGIGASGMTCRINGTTLNFTCRLASADTNHSSTYTVADDTIYYYKIVRNASDATFTLYDTSRSVLMTGTVGGVPATSTGMRVMQQGYKTTAGSVTVFRSISMGILFRG